MWTISNDHHVTCLKRFLNPYVCSCSLWAKRFYVSKERKQFLVILTWKLTIDHSNNIDRPKQVQGCHCQIITHDHLFKGSRSMLFEDAWCQTITQPPIIIVLLSTYSSLIGKAKCYKRRVVRRPWIRKWPTEGLHSTRPPTPHLQPCRNARRPWKKAGWNAHQPTMTMTWRWP